MVLLPNGQALIAGGYDATHTKDLRSAELYDPVSGSWIRTGTMNKERVAFTMNLLSTGHVLVAGGQGDSGVIAEAELVQPCDQKVERHRIDVECPTRTYRDHVARRAGGGGGRTERDSGRRTGGNLQPSVRELVQWRVA